MAAYRAVFGHVNEILPGALFVSRRAVKDAGLHKESEAGISWGRDDAGERVADAIVLNKGYEDDRDGWDEVIYTGSGGRDRNTGRQIAHQSWETPGNAGLRRSGLLGHAIRVIRGSEGEPDYSPIDGYRYDGLYRIDSDWAEEGQAGFQICRFKLQRLTDDAQEVMPVEQQVHEILERATRRKTTTVERIVRDTSVTQRVKRWYGYVCQICGISLKIGADGKGYAEGAHIHALGGSDGGPDVEGNVLCLCPNCHVRLDRGALYLTDDFRVIERYEESPGSGQPSRRLRIVAEHRIGVRFVRAHRRLWGIDPR